MAGTPTRVLGGVMAMGLALDALGVILLLPPLRWRTMEERRKRSGRAVGGQFGALAAGKVTE